MKKIIFAVIIILILAVAWWLGSPLFLDKKVSEEFPASAQTQTENQNPASGIVETSIVLRGFFEGFDAVHKGSGEARIIRTQDGFVLRFEDDFTVTNGPDLYVGLGKNGTYIKGSEIARLKGNIGSQNYTLPSTLSSDDYNEVWIWCKAFAVPFAKAELKSL